MEKIQRVEIKERGEWSGIAEFLGNIIAKYADVVDSKRQRYKMG